ncbi:MAG: hypothetical protein WC762_10805 [Methylobacter sp.]
MITKILFISLLTGSAILSGCASQAVTSDQLVQNTAFALGLNASDFTISNRIDSGIKTTYSVETKSGQQYNCYVTGTLSIVGRVVSDAMCTQKGQLSKTHYLESN